MPTFRSPAVAVAALLLALLPWGTALAAPTLPPPPAPGSPGAGVDSGPGTHACAATGWPWSCVAECESGGDWAANTGNG
ncbi:hypothetical protein [Streptomyces sp. NPDC020965]|uniref:hypothetical protein n=1 Tax=Streptomyces sp. NPDC020965 TaxID=3365105 RepID=UPI0037A524DE